MYRRVNIPKLLEDWNINAGWNDDGPMELWDGIEQNLKTITPSYKATWSAYVQEAEDMFDGYMEELETIQWYYHPKPWKQERLNEIEVFLQCILGDTSKRTVRGRGRQDYLHSLRQEYGGLVDSVRSEVWSTVEGRYQRAAACFYVGINS